MFDLHGRRAVVTGASNGIGQAIAVALAQAGADVAGLDIQDGSTTSAGIQKAGRRALFFEADVSDGALVEAIASQVEQAWGGIDIWINNAGRLLVKPFTETDERDFLDLLAVNLVGCFHGCRAAVSRMVDQGYGRIVNVSSVTRHQPVSGLTAYVTTKAAIDGLTKSLALELGSQGVTVNSIAPGATLTAMNPGLYTPEVMETYVQRIAIPRIAVPADLAGAAVFLASDEASYITGHEILVDGGLSLNGNVGFAEEYDSAEVAPD